MKIILLLLFLIFPSIANAQCAGSVTMGYSVQGSTTDTDPNKGYFNEYTAPGSGSETITTAHVNFSGSGSDQIGVFANNAGAPGTLMGSSGVSAVVAGWNSIPVTVVIVGGTNYWLSEQVTGTEVRYDTPSTPQSPACADFTTNSGSFISPGTSSTAYSFDGTFFKLSLYVEICPTVSNSYVPAPMPLRLRRY